MSVSLQDWVWIKATFVQAMVGAISSNFREVVLSRDGDEWILNVRLAEENDEDREEIEEIVNDFSIFLEDTKKNISEEAYSRTKSNIIISKNPMKDIGRESRVLFRLRE